MTEFTYVGDELDLFANAVNWKEYWAALIRPYLIGDVLEVGAGLGTNTASLVALSRGRWVCVEPDPALARRLAERIRELPDAARVTLHIGTLDDLAPDARFDTILYIDVLEHIEDDARELRTAAERLGPDGRIIVLAPAHNWLFSSFDRAVGHHRRYTRTTLRRAFPASITVERLLYADSVGMLASLANRFGLRQAYPTPAQLRLWDRVLVPASRCLDPVLGRRIGKSVLAVGRATAARRQPGSARTGRVAAVDSPT